MQSLYLVIAAVLLLNLLIAIITNRYSPDDVVPEMRLRHAQVVSTTNCALSLTLAGVAAVQTDVMFRMASHISAYLHCPCLSYRSSITTCK
jgi:hypothetical protein